MKNIKLKSTTLTLFLAIFILTGFAAKPFTEKPPEIKSSIRKNTNEKTNKKDTFANFSTFKGKVVSGSIYLQWTVEGLRQNGIFLIYSSADGIDYDPIGTKNAVGVSIDNPIAYYFNLKDSGEPTQYFKIVYVSNDSRFQVSDLLIIKGPEELCLTEKKSLQ